MVGVALALRSCTSSTPRLHPASASSTNAANPPTRPLAHPAICAYKALFTRQFTTTRLPAHPRSAEKPLPAGCLRAGGLRVRRGGEPRGASPVHVAVGLGVELPLQREHLQATQIIHAKIATKMSWGNTTGLPLTVTDSYRNDPPKTARNAFGSPKLHQWPMAMLWLLRRLGHQGAWKSRSCFQRS